MEKVIEFNQEILNINPRIMGLQSAEEAGLSFIQLQEEAKEYDDSYREGDFVGCVDAVLDSIYFSYGILYKMGLTENLVDELFNAVHIANMHKAKGKKAGREGFDAADANKPLGWVDPREAMKEVLNANNNRGS